MNGITYGWLFRLANMSRQPYTQLVEYEKNNTANIIHFELQGGPSRQTMYVTALYYTMTCMTSVGFGNVAAETDNEKIFSICMMIVAGMCAYLPIPYHICCRTVDNIFTLNGQNPRVF